MKPLTAHLIPLPAPRSRAFAARGFTLIELMVALSGGLFLSMIVFALARDSNRFYQQQTRLANATLSGIVGFDRLRADIARAAFLSTPNLRGPDPHVCSQPTETWPERIRYLAGIRLIKNASAPSATLTNNGIVPMSLLLAGAFTAPDEFPVRTVVNNGPTTDVYLQVNTGPMARLGYSVSGPDGGDTTAQQTLLESVFRPDRILRILDKSGAQHYSVIQSVTGGTNPFITLTGDAPLTFRASTNLECGLKGLEVGATANVVNVMQYDVRSLKDDDNYKPLFAPGTQGDYDGDRTELVRTELDAAGDPIAGSTELVAEYAVDFQLGFTAWDKNTNTLPTLAEGDGDFTTYMPDDEADPPLTQRLRAIRARLSVRSREADRGENVDPTLNGLYRIGLGNAGGAPFARVRTFQADIALHNHGRTEW